MNSLAPLPRAVADAAPEVLGVSGLGKSFVLHLRGGMELPVVSGAAFSVRAGTCVALGGPSGAGKSSILKMVFGNYRIDRGHILIRDGDETVDMATASPRRILRLRRERIGYVSQFLRVIPRLSTLDVVSEPLRLDGVPASEALRRAQDLLARLNLPERLWDLPPATFSGGEQQRVNIARGFIAPRALLLLDEPTASLDARNSAAVIDLINARKAEGTAMLGIFHDEAVRTAVADAVVDVTRFGDAA